MRRLDITDPAEVARRAARKRRAADPAKEATDEDARLARALHAARGTRGEL